jgi:L-rhamnose-H+ transport protein
VLSGFGLVVIAGFCQGSFVLPMTLARKWRWEHMWVTFSVLGMLIFNWILAFASIPNLRSALASVLPRDLATLILFGAGWGIGAILFGLGMERLGMSLGYPIIMGLIACLGAVIPLAVFFPETLLAPKGSVLLAGTAVAILGIILCSLGGARKQPLSTGPQATHTNFAGALAIAILAGVLSCLPNLGIAFGGPVIRAAVSCGASENAAANAVWVLFFTAGGIVNCAYCTWLIFVRRSRSDYFGSETKRNVRLAALMAALWIGSFYLYGMGSRSLGTWGLVAGWPLFISLSIGTGILWGLRRGEWEGAPASARTLRNWGLVALLFAVLMIAVSEIV